jgi:hypothetical protein
LRSQESEQLRRRRLERREGHLALIAAHPKLGIEMRRLNQALIHPMKSPAMRALSTEVPKTVNHSSRIKRKACNRKHRNSRWWRQWWW